MAENMTCTPNCPYFPILENQIEWEYDSKIPYLKKRKHKKKFICGYDGHVIISWYENCPKNKTEKA